MRTLNEAAAGWRDAKAIFRKHKSLDSLREAIQNNRDASGITQPGVRSVFWKAWLFLDTNDTTAWPKLLAESRSAYASIREHYQSDDDHAAAQPGSIEDSELRLEIRQDVERCMPDNLYFRQPSTQNMLSDILYVYCKLNPDLGYRQGMHELLAPVLWVIERDAIDLGQNSKAFGEDVVIRTVFDADHVEHDSFTLFCHIMQSAKSFYEQTTHAAAESPIVTRSRFIIEGLLAKVDPELAQHLESIEILPQIFLMRWVRLLFGREFSFDQTLLLWDVVFAVDASLEIVNYISVLMLLRIRWELLGSNYHDALTLLLQSGHTRNTFSMAQFALDACYMRQHPNFEGGSYLVLKYTGRAVQPVERPNTPPALQRNITTFSGALQAIRSTPSRARASGQSRNIESVLQSTARNIYAQSERLGIGKAVRSVVDEVHRKALEVRDNRDAFSSPSESKLKKQLQDMELRQTCLATLLGDALESMSLYQKHSGDDSDDITRIPLEGQLASVRDLDAAIAKVQFVHVHLQNPSLSLNGYVNDESPTNPEETTSRTVETASDYDLISRDPQASGSACKHLPHPQDPELVVPSSEADIAVPAVQSWRDFVGNAESEAGSPTHRPVLEDSQFSWMLEREDQKAELIDKPADDQGSAHRSPLFHSVGSTVVGEPGPEHGSSTMRSARIKTRRSEIKRTAVDVAEDPFALAIQGWVD